ncbi:MAG: GNAT family N-acetyltransferase [Anaeromicrobium sp.]|uniref:GNAT family N-acetyltransferase n=1 Tax=Anaeromicrobium sp. TaxID=1929132 RepID=UPI0025DFD3F0|nr:GNAT family N-acetyltransferase [Anaeromicrobium sp.]MCT4594750.1 GNAT family N-acetyltransferase [Anaeromicrobium sp.]
MNLVEVTDYKEIYENDHIVKLMFYSMVRPTIGRVQSVAQSTYSKQQGKFYKAMEDDKILGIIGLKRINNDRLDILHISVDEQMRNKGIGKAMIKEAGTYDRVDEMRVETSHNMVNFYKKCGFRTKLVENELGLDEYICTLKLR